MIETYTYPYVSEVFTERGDILNEMYEMTHPTVTATMEDFERFKKMWSDCRTIEKEKGIEFKNWKWDRYFYNLEKKIYYTYNPEPEPEEDEKYDSGNLRSEPKKKRRRIYNPEGKDWTAYNQALEDYERGYTNEDPFVNDDKYYKTKYKNKL